MPVVGIAPAEFSNLKIPFGRIETSRHPTLPIINEAEFALGSSVNSVCLKNTVIDWGSAAGSVAQVGEMPVPAKVPMTRNNPVDVSSPSIDCERCESGKSTLPKIRAVHGFIAFASIPKSFVAKSPIMFYLP